MLLPIAILFLNKHPVARFGNEFLPPIHAHLLTHFFDGLYYGLLNEQDNPLANSMGLAFQDYLRELLAQIKTSVAGIDTDPKATYRRKYHGQIPDVVIETEDAVVLFEFKSARLPVQVRFTGRLDKLGGCQKTLRKGISQLVSFRKFFSGAVGNTKPIYLVLVLWEDLWYWFVRHNWDVLYPQLKDVLPAGTRNSADAGLFITGLRGYEKLVSIEEARLKGRDISLIECLTDYLDYMRQINRTTYGAKCPITGGFPHELSEFATEQYLRSKGIDALEQPRILRDINDEFIEEYLQRLGREIPIFKDQAESDTLALSRPGA